MGVGGKANGEEDFHLVKNILSFLVAFTVITLRLLRRESICLNKSCKKADLGMAAVGNLRALFLDLRGRINSCSF